VIGPAEVLAALPAGALRALAHGLRSGNLSSASSAARLADALGVSAIAAETLRSALGAAAESGAVALAAESVLAARKDASAHQLSTLVEPVLSGPTVAGVDMRDTAVVFSTLMREARHEVLVTSFVAGFARELLVPLAEFLEADPSRRAILVLNFQRGNDSTAEEDLAARRADEFWSKQWPGGSRRPMLCYDPRGLAEGKAARATMHAKVVVIDRRKALVTSANLTARAQAENIELGLLVDHAPTSQRIAAYFDGLIAAGVLRRV
jgi:phosphatidylserine/phosphatidylglycerophosphate/cardiolipin synthase-like enzyme